MDQVTELSYTVSDDLVEIRYVLERENATYCASYTATRDQLPEKVTDKDVQDLILSLFK